MSYRLALGYVLFIVYLTSVTHVVGNEPQAILNSGGNLKSGRPRREFNTTRTLKSAKINNFALKDNNINRHTSLNVEQFETRLNHFSTDDLRTVEFVRFLIYNNDYNK